jgi:hypothetical protein
MRINEIPVGESIITEYILQEAIPTEPKGEERPKQKNLSLEDYAQLYANEHLVRIDNKPFPFVFFNEFHSLKTQTISILPVPYQVPNKYKKATDAIFEQTRNPADFDGQSVSMADLIIDGQKTKIIARQAGYFDFKKTNLSMDVYLSQFDNSFKEGETLRDHEIVERCSKELKYSNMANILGMGCVIFNEKENFLILEQRKKNLAVGGGTIGCLGGTPEWQQEWMPNKDIDFAAYLQRQFEKEMEEELCLSPDEFSFVKGIWVKDFMRAPDIFVCLETKLSMQVIAQRCSQSDKATEEHTSIFRVPINKKVLASLFEGTHGYEINNPSKVAYSLTVIS